MESNLTELRDIAFVMLVAVTLGLFLVRLRQPPIVGYILAGIVLGPTGLGLVPNSEPVQLLAELGVLVLLFLIGMELSIRAFVLFLRPAVITAGLQIASALCITFAIGYFADWSANASLLLGFAVAVSSTALAIKMLEDIGELRSNCGRITVGVLIAQDIAIVPILLLASSLGAGGTLDLALLGKIGLAIGTLVALIWALGGPGKVKLPFSDRIEGRPDLLTLAMLAFCLAGAAASGLFGLSPIYGAFVAGLIVGKSTLRTAAIPATQPVQSLLIVVFFLSIGLLIDLQFIAANWAILLAFVVTILAVKSVLNVAILRFAGMRWEVAFQSGLIMAQIGEFSFVIAAVGLTNGVIDQSLYQSVIAVIAISLLISPFWLVNVRRFHRVAEKGIASARQAIEECYEDEIAGLSKGAARLQRARRLAKRGMDAAKTAAMRRIGGKAAVIGEGTRSRESADPPALDEGAVNFPKPEYDAREGDIGEPPRSAGAKD